MNIPINAVSLMMKVYRQVLPAVKQELHHWRELASGIPNKELRTQALASIDQKEFHCQGGAILALVTEQSLSAGVALEKAAEQSLSAGVALEKAAEQSLSAGVALGKAAEQSLSAGVALEKAAEQSLSAGVDLGKAAEQSLSAGVALGKVAEQSLSAGVALGKAAEQHQYCLRFIVAFQTISDYLDNLCDRSTSLDQNDFAALHEAMIHAITPDDISANYYRFRTDQDDGGYLRQLVKTCRECLQKTVHYPIISSQLLVLTKLYCELQIYKHLHVSERELKLKQWFEAQNLAQPALHWFEFAACAGSTLGVFSLVAYSFHENLNTNHVEQIVHGYFPYVQGLHILLDYFIDQEEDKLGGDLNFCSYYETEAVMMERLQWFISISEESLNDLPHAKFHQLIQKGLLGIYLSDEKVQQQNGMKKLAKQLLQQAGMTSKFFYHNAKAFRLIKSLKNRSKQQSPDVTTEATT